MMQNLQCLHVRSIAVVLAVLLGSAHLAYSAEPLLGAGAGSADVPRATASAAGKSPAPITVICGPNGLTISSSDLEALDQFERMLATAAQRSGNGPLAIFYLKYAKAQAVAEELEKILAGGSSDAEGSSEQGPDSSRRRRQGRRETHLEIVFDLATKNGSRRHGNIRLFFA